MALLFRTMDWIRFSFFYTVQNKCNFLRHFYWFLILAKGWLWKGHFFQWLGGFFLSLNILVRKERMKEECLVLLSEIGLGIRFGHPKILEGISLSTYICGTTVLSRLVGTALTLPNLPHLWSVRTVVQLCRGQKDEVGETCKADLGHDELQDPGLLVLPFGTSYLPTRKSGRA